MSETTQRRLQILKSHLHLDNSTRTNQLVQNESNGLVSFAFKTWAQKPQPQHITENGKAILVTGAAGGLGSDLCLELLKKGCKVFACDLKTEYLEKAFEGVSKQNLIFIEMDVSNPESVNAAADNVKEQLQGNKLFAIVNNAGVGSVPGSRMMKALVEHNESEMRSMFDVNVLGTIRVTNALYPLLTKSKTDKDASGVVVNIASVAGLLGIPYGSYYSASKFAVVGYSDSLRRELASVGVRVGCVEPGFTKTAFLKPYEVDDNSEFAKQTTRRHKIMKKWTDDAQDPEEVTKAIMSAIFTTPCPEHQLVDKAKYKTINKMLFQYFPYYISDKMMV
ncbi:retinol dehydrogenase [Acrasis kona]|uniref:Retinol dehydrogenase n=1 Tax=Acrasis kona TaxID=1008807 RepID=A0AAW2YYV1_9EUKA